MRDQVLPPLETPDGRDLAVAGRRRFSLLVSLSTLLWLASFAAVVWFAAQDVGLHGQYLIGGIAIAALLLMRVLKPKGFLRVFLFLLIAFVSIRYFTWRTLYTIPPVDSVSFVPGLLLYLAEVQGMVTYMLGLFVNVSPIDRTVAPLPADEADIPTVDVFVPSYNESTELLRVTLTAATQIAYPEGKLAVYLLDDGGTDQKCDDPDPDKAAAALTRRLELRELCAELGVTYLTRARNLSAKAGNINAALPRTAGELILILDADHVPSQDILERTVGRFATEPDLFMVQTPHFFVTPDPIERNLDTFRTMPSENEMFYGVIQKGLDFWNSSFFCGSAAVLRRRHLEAVGGISGSSITEDAETSLELHSRGLRSVYIDRPMVAGLSPDTFAAFITQRIRWAQGMTQILMLQNPLFKRGLTLAQRLCYLSSSLFWLFPLGRLVFLVAPLFYLFGGLKVFAATLDEFLAFAVFHVVCSLMMSNALFGRHRWPFVSDLYELLQSLFIFGALVEVIRHPRRPEFKVTPKAEDVTRNHVSQLAWVFFAVLAVQGVGALAGLYRYYAFPLEQSHTVIVMVWHILNMGLTLGAIGVMYERARHRDSERIRRNKPVNLLGPGRGIRARLVDVWMTGGRLVAPQDRLVDALIADGHAEVQLALPGVEELRTFRIVLDAHRFERGQAVLDVRWVVETAEDHRDLVRLCFGDSAVWVAFQAERRRSKTLLGGLATVVLLGARRTLAMIRASSDRRTHDAAAVPTIEPAARTAGAGSK